MAAKTAGMDMTQNDVTVTPCIWGGVHCGGDWLTVLRIQHFVIILKYRLSGITVSVIFSPVAGVKVWSLYSISVILYHYPMLLIKVNYCSGKMFVSDNHTLRCISWLIRNRFIAVGSVYSVWSPLQSAGSIKESIWLTSAQTVRFRFYCAIPVLLYSVFLNCIFLCMCIYVSCATLGV